MLRFSVGVIWWWPIAVVPCRRPLGACPNPAAPRLRTLHQRYAVDELSESMTEGLLNGHGAMPDFSFSDREANDIIAYLQSIQARPTRAR